MEQVSDDGSGEMTYKDEEMREKNWKCRRKINEANGEEESRRTGGKQKKATESKENYLCRKRCVRKAGFEDEFE